MLKSHVLVICHTPSADPRILGRAVRNPEMAEARKTWNFQP